MFLLLILPKYKLSFLNHK